ncbi:MAG: hypothetical protein WBD62_18325 [Anaerolineales bacterium]
MSELMDLLRGPALGVIVMIILLAGVLLITAFAALMAQMGLLVRMRSWNTSEKQSQGQGSGTRQPGPYGYSSSVRDNQQTSPAYRTRSPQVVVLEPDANEVVDAVWREVH